MPRALAQRVVPAELEITQLAFLVGSAANAWVLEELERAGFDAIRPSHGHLIQHLLSGPRAIGELAGLLGITQQAVSKSAAELQAAGVVESVASDDARVRKIQLSRRGEQAVRTTRALRRKLEKRIARRCGDAALAAAKRVLAQALEAVGGGQAVLRRRVRPPT
jgi:DNA-binding MarR family transcriptional regulator